LSGTDRLSKRSILKKLDLNIVSYTMKI
jgi:hypothetical protein